MSNDQSCEQQRSKPTLHRLITRLPIRLQMTCIIITLFLPLLLLSTHHYIAEIDRVTAEIDRSAQHAALDVATNLEGLINETVGILKTLANHPAVISQNKNASHRLFDGLLPHYPQRLNIIASNMAGENVGSAIQQLSLNDGSVSGEEWFELALRGEEEVIGTLYTCSLFRRPALMIAQPVYSAQDQVIGVLSIPLDLQQISQSLISCLPEQGRCDIVVVDARGTVIIDTSAGSLIGKQLKDTPLAPFRFTQARGSVTGQGSDGITRLVGTAAIGDSGWRVLVSIPSHVIDAHVSNTRSALIINLFACLAALALAILLGRSITGRIGSLVQGLREIEQGNLAYRLRRSGNGEIDTIATTFNAMATRLQEGEQTIQRMKSDLELRVAERTAQLASTNHELESFSYSVSHDLRAPIRHIDAYARIILEEHHERLDPDAAIYMQRIRRSAGKMTGLIEALLSMAGLARLDIFRELIDLSDMAREIAGELQNSAPERHVDFIISDGMTVYADVRLIRIVMENLMGNAWKYSSKKERAVIEVGSAEQDGKTSYYVRDNGAGFDMAYANKLFAAFQRLHTERDFEGIGIGLATVQRVIHRHMGRVWAEAAPGVGATFWFTLN